METSLKVPTLIYSRVVGYYSPVQTNWNKGKKSEFADRKYLKFSGAELCQKKTAVNGLERC